MAKEINVLQITNGYLEKALYRNLFSAIEHLKITNKVFVPINKRKEAVITRQENENVIVAKCFNEFDRRLFFPKQRKTIAEIENSYDLTTINFIHAHTLFSTGYSAYRLHKKYSIPYIVAVRNTDVNLFFEKIPLFRKIGIEIMNHSSGVIFLSQPYADMVLNKYVKKNDKEEIASKIYVIPNGIDDFFFTNKRTESRYLSDLITLIYVGDVNNNKNVLETIQAVEKLRERLNVRFRIVGQILDKELNTILCNKEFIDYASKTDLEGVLRFLKDSDIFVMPSHHETFGLVYAEAMSQGLPVLYTKSQGFDGQFEDGVVGYSVSDIDYMDLVNKIRLTIDNYENISKNCLNAAERFKWSNIAKEYQRIYEQNCGGK